MIIDFSELEKKSFECKDGCGMCCLCQPELSEEEYDIFQVFENLKEGLTCNHVNGKRTAKPTAIKLQGKWGACHFLNNRRCTINEIKPRFCQQFPVHIHVFQRIQLNVNRSCRGVTEGGDDLVSKGKTMIKKIREEMLAEELAKAKQVAHEFDQRCRKAGVFQSQERIRSVESNLTDIIGKEEGIGQLLAYVNGKPKLGAKPVDEICGEIAAEDAPGDLGRIANESNYEIFNQEDITRLPVYVDEELMWNVFQARNGGINCMVLEENGFLQLRKHIEMRKMGLLPRDEDALRTFADYARLLCSRDQFQGYSASVCDRHRYKDDLLTVHIGVLGTKLLDLWWRASLLGMIYEMSEIDAWLAEEAVKAFDMDCLDAPTIGSFI